LPGYKDALEHGWSPDNVNLEKTAKIHLAKIAEDPSAFVASLYDPEAKGAAVVMPDGTTRPRIPGVFLWMWDGEFCGSLSLRWQNGTPELPDYCLGHIGYSVVPWKRRRGYATTALGLTLAEAKRRGLAYVQITADRDNLPSHRVILANGGRSIPPRHLDPAYGEMDEVMFRIDL
jgi:predicted acetyltransferase